MSDDQSRTTKSWSYDQLAPVRLLCAAAVAIAYSCSGDHLAVSAVFAGYGAAIIPQIIAWGLSGNAH